MNHRLFKSFCDIAYARAGIALKDGKESLVSARVSKRLRQLDLPTPEAYLEFLEQDTTGKELVAFLDAITTNFTSFYREPDHFDTMLGWLADRGVPNKLRVWCCASSTGEEPYTIAMTLAEAFEGRHVDYKILATDISTRVLAIAKAGIYPAPTLKPVSASRRRKYFDEIRDGNEVKYQANGKLKEHVSFARLNLSTPPFPMRGPLHIVFCRNVMIYFDRDVRQRLISGIEDLMPPGGLLMTGHSETLAGLDTAFRGASPSVYLKPDPQRHQSLEIPGGDPC